jgi:hypothetical protein
MATLWPWLAVAGIGGLHGLNPASGWMFVAAWGVHSHDGGRALWGLVPLALGHAASLALVAAAVVAGLSLDRAVLQALAGALLVLTLLLHLAGRTAARAPAGYAGLALWSFFMSTAHGAGLLLVPALFSLCVVDASAADSSTAGSLLQALAVIGVHTGAMLVVSGVMATGVCRGFAAFARAATRRARATPLAPNPPPAC